MDLKCMGTDCPLKETCRRYTDESNKIQNYLLDSPYEDGKCDLYWGDTQEYLFNFLKLICNEGTK